MGHPYYEFAVNFTCILNLIFVFTVPAASNYSDDPGAEYVFHYYYWEWVQIGINLCYLVEFII